MAVPRREGTMSKRMATIDRRELMRELAAAAAIAAGGSAAWP